MPVPSSAMRIRERPPSVMSISMARADASSAFSRSSLTTDAGRSMTSPAAIWSTTVLGRTAIRGMKEATRGCRGWSIARERYQECVLDPTFARPGERDPRPVAATLVDAHHLTNTCNGAILGGECGEGAERAGGVHHRQP